MQVGIQPYTIRRVDEPFAAKLARIARAGYNGVELGPDKNTQPVRDALTKHDLAVSSIGSGLESLETDDDFEEHRAASEAFGTDDVILMWIDAEHFETHDAVAETADRLSRLAAGLADHGLQLHYHNHAHEFTDLGDTTGYEALVDATEGVHFELDLGWAGTGGHDPIALLDSIGDRVSLVHAKDMHFESGEFATIGEGDLDVGACVDAARRNDVEWVIFENDEPTDPVTEISHGSVTLDQYTDHYC